MSTPSSAQQMPSTASSYGHSSQTSSTTQTMEILSVTPGISASTHSRSLVSLESQTKLGPSPIQQSIQTSLSNVQSSVSVPATQSTFSSEFSVPPQSGAKLNSMSLPTSQPTSSVTSPSVMTASVSPTSYSRPSFSMPSHDTSPIATVSRSSEGINVLTKSAGQPSQPVQSLGTEQSNGATSAIAPIASQSSSLTASSTGGTLLISTMGRSELSPSPSVSRMASSAVFNH